MTVNNVKTPYSPEDVDYDASRLEAINAHFERLISQKKVISAAYMLSRDQKVFAHAAIGPKSGLAGEKELLKPDAIFNIYSITKLFTSVAIFKLAEDGFLRPLQPAKDFLPEMDKEPFNEITIAHLLTHTSGLFPDPGAFFFEFTSPWDTKFVMSHMEPGENWIDAALKTGMHCKPGTQWNYCTFGFSLLGEIIARITGMRAEDYIMKNLVEPCGMKDTMFMNKFYLNELPSEWAEKMLERFYFHFEDEYEQTHSYLEAYAKGERPNIKEINPVKWFKWTQPTTGNGLVSTVADLNKFGRMLLNNGIAENGNRIIGRKAIERMSANYTTPDIGEYTWGTNGLYRMYGLGPDTRRTADSHFSEGTYFHEGYGACSLTIDPKEKFVASWFSPYPDGNWIADGLYNASAVMWSGIK